MWHKNCVVTLGKKHMLIYNGRGVSVAAVPEIFFFLDKRLNSSSILKRNDFIGVPKPQVSAKNIRTG